MFIILISYRARGIQTFRRYQIINAINNFKNYFEQSNIDYRIVICEQNNDNKFNRGLLLNSAFIESEKIFNFPKKYMHMNTDYTFNLSRNFPQELLDFKDGFMDLHRPNFPVLGAACMFDSDSYKTINGFPNNLEGWGGDDWAIYNRIIKNNIKLDTPNGLFNSGFIIEENYQFNNDTSDNTKNSDLARDNDFINDYMNNGVNSILYNVDGYGEFNDGKIVFHYLITPTER